MSIACLRRNPPGLNPLRFLSIGLSVLMASLTCFQAALPLAEAAEQRKLYFFHNDHLGSTTMVTNEQGQIVARAEYAPYGATVTQTGATQPTHRFTGQRLDTSTSLYFFNARYYDPQLGRFLSVDPKAAWADPQSLNAYSYARNNPTNIVDPSGEFIQFLFAALIKAVIEIAALAASTAIVTGTASLVASATGHERAAARFAKVAMVSSFIAMPLGFVEGGAMSVLAALTLANAAGDASKRTNEESPDSPQWQPAVVSLIRSTATTVVTSAIGLGLSAVVRVVPFALQQIEREGLRRWAAGYGRSIIEDTIPAGRRLMVKPGAINAPMEYTKPGETFIRVSDNPAGLKFSFRSPGGAHAKTSAFPEEQFRKFNNDRHLMKYFGDLPGGPPTMYGRFTPPPGTPIKRGTVPGNQFGGAGGAQEVYFPDEF